VLGMHQWAWLQLCCKSPLVERLTCHLSMGVWVPLCDVGLPLFIMPIIHVPSGLFVRDLCLACSAWQCSWQVVQLAGPVLL
jgi:hypothetical protein